jgi:hypothetical protein
MAGAAPAVGPTNQPINRENRSDVQLRRAFGIARINASPRISGTSGSPRSRMTLGFAFEVWAMMRGKSRSFVINTNPWSRAYSQMIESAAPTGPTADQ